MYRNSKLLLAIKSNDIVGIRKLLTPSFGGLIKAADVNAPLTIEAYNPLIVASQNGFTEIAELLIQHEAAIDKPDNQGNTALIWAIKINHLKLTEILLNSGANPNVKNKYGNSPVVFAVANNNSVIVNLLLAFKVDVNVKIFLENMIGETPFLLAVRNKNLEIAKLLITSYANKTDIENDYHSALLIACENGFYEIVELICQSDVKLNIKDKFDNTPLHLAIRNAYKGQSYYNIIEKLLKKGIDIKIKNLSGQTPVVLSLLLGKMDIVNLLIKHGAEISDEERIKIEPKKGDVPQYFCSTCLSLKVDDEIEEDFYNEDEWVRIWYLCCRTCKTAFTDEKGNKIITKIEN